MSPGTEPPARCPRCGTDSALGLVGGLCPTCLARQAWIAETASPGRSPAADAPEQPPLVPGWRITTLIGVGGMGRVYRVESDETGVVGALKVLDARWAGDATAVARFEAEAAALRALDHPNIVRVLDTTEADDGRFCLVMEFVEGCDLGRLLRVERLAPERAIGIFQKVCAAVASAHAAGLTHRDIKPANILVNRHDTVKLVDFGLAGALDPAGGGHSTIGSLTTTTDQFGTAYYLAPERIRGRTTPGPAADVYALGVLLYHLLSGEMPLGNYTSLSESTGLSPRWDRLIARALEADPAKRTPSVAELDSGVADLWAQHLAGAHRSLRWRRTAALAGAVLLIAATALGGAQWQRSRMRPVPVVFADPAHATREQPWENSLGMKFVPVPGTGVLFSIYETRRRDVDAFLEASRSVFAEDWLAGEAKRRQEIVKRSIVSLPIDEGDALTFDYQQPGWPVTPDHPAFLVAIADVQRYCLWLTWKERNEGRLSARQRYRVPTTAEWLTACGGAGSPLRPGNLAGPEARTDEWPASWPTIETRDPFPRTAPVGSFPAEPHGLFDLSGNVSEWVNDNPGTALDDERSGRSFLRGPAFGDGTAEKTSFAYLRRPLRGKRVPIAGFRVVLEYRSSDPPP